MSDQNEKLIKVGGPKWVYNNMELMTSDQIKLIKIGWLKMKTIVNDSAQFANILFLMPKMKDESTRYSLL